MQFKFNLPNIITLVRVLFIPALVLAFFSSIPYKNVISALIFLMLSFSDMLDGYLARKRQQVTEFGKLIDPIADKILISTALIMLTGRGIALWMTIVIMAREVILTAIRIYLLKSHPVIPASALGKAKTFVQTFAIAFAILQIPFAWHIMLVAVLLTVISGIEYLFQIKSMTGNEIVNFPNFITMSRFLLIIPFVYFFWYGQLLNCIVIFAFIAVSDKLDGISARMMNQKTELGGALDSFTDWSLIIWSFTMLVIKGYIAPLWVFLMLAPSLVSGSMKMIHAKRVRRVPVTWIAKLSVGLTYAALITILVRFAFDIHLLEPIMKNLMFLALLTVYISMVVYVFKITALKT